MIMERKPRDNRSESDNSLQHHVGNENRSQLKRMSLKSINQKYRCKFCQRRFQRNRSGFLIFRRHVKNHEKRYFAYRYRPNGVEQNVLVEIKSEIYATSQPNEASTEMSSRCDDVEKDTKSSFTSRVVLKGNVSGGAPVVPT